MNDHEKWQAAANAYSAGDWPKAAECCSAILASRANHYEALNLLGIIKAQTQQTREAADLLRRAAATNPGNAVAHNNYGNVLRDLERYRDAVDSYDSAVTIDPAYSEAYCNRGGALLSLGRIEDALQSYDQALKFRPDYVEARFSRGVVLYQLGRFEEALDSYARTVKLRPTYVEAHYNLGNALYELRRFDQAVRSYGRALQLKENFAEAHNNHGNALFALGRLDEAHRSYERALQYSPNLANAYNNIGNLLNAARRPQEALVAFERALTLDPEFNWAFGMRLHCKMLLCDWDGLPAAIDDLARKAVLGKRATRPFTVLALSDDLALHRQVAAISAHVGDYVSRALPPITKQARRSRIRIGYYSADYLNHATAQLMAELFELHDKRKFEIVAFSFGPETRDPMRQRLENAFDRFVDVRLSSDREVAQLSRDMGIDIAVDLKGFTQDSRPGIFAHRAAPIQVSYLGYPGTMGADFMDYVFADHTVIPPESRPHFSEHVIYLPHSYQVNDRHRIIAEEIFTRAQLGLPQQGFVFCCFNNMYKIAPGTFDSWMRILKRVDGSVLWLLTDNSIAADNLRKEAERRGVSASRLVFAESMPLSRHLARHRAADLCLDSFPCGAHTTASDALWAGLPVITRPGESFASRVAASLLNAVGMPDLIAASEDQYEALAVQIATEPPRLAGLKARLRAARLTQPLFDTPQATRHLEQAYALIHDRYHAELEPVDLDVAELASRSLP
ncbi:MAG TPA: tetratricopeptide repeat protein [Steroidobacteraceae bacterium]